jgi:hypothetical protein
LSGISASEHSIDTITGEYRETIYLEDVHVNSNSCVEKSSTTNEKRSRHEKNHLPFDEKDGKSHSWKRTTLQLPQSEAQSDEEDAGNPRLRYSERRGDFE